MSIVSPSDTMIPFKDLKDARLALLGEACRIASSVRLEYAVCGGWSPLLRNSSPITHPGTKDVDLLFANGVDAGGLKRVFEAFLNHGFVPSAKHEFQLIKVYSVGGSTMAFNVDLLHPTEGNVHGDMFVDHLDLPVLEDRKAITSLFMEKSIAAPYSAFVFAGFIDYETVTCPYPDGKEVEVNIPLIDEVGVLVTKSESCRSPKRPRDLFDIFLAISQPRDADNFGVRLDLLKQYHPAAFNLLAEIYKSYSLIASPRALNRSVFSNAGIEYDEATAKIDRFLQEWGLPKPEQKCLLS
jgi:hypothetical protein